MSKTNDADNQEQRERIAAWVKQGKKASSSRKQRNQALIHLGLAALDMIKTSKLDCDKVIPHIIVNKVPIVKNLIAEEVERSLI